MATETLFGGPINFSLKAVAASLVVEVDAKQGYQNTTGSKPWMLGIYIDGVLRGSADGAGAYTDCPTARAIMTQVPAGSHAVTIQWYGDSTMQLSRANLTINWSYK